MVGKKPEDQPKESSAEQPVATKKICKDNKHNLHESSDANNIYYSCRNCDFVEAKPR